MSLAYLHRLVHLLVKESGGGQGGADGEGALGSGRNGDECDYGSLTPEQLLELLVMPDTAGKRCRCALPWMCVCLFWQVCVLLLWCVCGWGERQGRGEKCCLPMETSGTDASQVPKRIKGVRFVPAQLAWTTFLMPQSCHAAGIRHDCSCACALSVPVP